MFQAHPILFRWEELHAGLPLRSGDAFWVVADLEGSELPHLDAARLEAIEAARELMSAAVRLGKDISSQSFSIRSEHGDILLVVRFADAISSND